MIDDRHHCHRPLRRRTLCAWGLSVLFASGCGYHYYAGPLRPADDQGPSRTIADDGSITYAQGRFEVRLRPVTDEELNRQFAAQSSDGPKSTNPFTYGDQEFWQGKPKRQRFTVFQLSVKNYAYPKVLVDPARVELRAGNGRRYWSLSVRQLNRYFRSYAFSYDGNAYARYKDRLDLLLKTLFVREEVFSGQETEGYLVFPVLHPDVKRVEAILHDVVLRFDFRNEPVEVVDISYDFQRDVGRLYPDGTVELSATD